MPSDEQTVDAAPTATVRAVNAVRTMASTDVRSRLTTPSRRAAWVGFAVMIVLSLFRASVDFVRDLVGSASPTPARALIAASATLGFWVVSLAAIAQSMRRTLASRRHGNAPASASRGG